MKFDGVKAWFWFDAAMAYSPDDDPAVRTRPDISQRMVSARPEVMR